MNKFTKTFSKSGKYIFLTLIAIVSLFPFYWMLVSMTNTSLQVQAAKMTPGNQFFVNLNTLLTSDLGFINAFKNSLIIAFITTVLALMISSFAGYGFEMYRTKNRDWVFNIILLSMMVPFAALMIPLFRMFATLSGSYFKFLGLNTFFAVIVPSIATAFLIFFFRQNSKMFPKELMEAARIDGVSEVGIFTKIYFPNMKNVYAAAAIITFMSSWNAYLWPLISLQSTNKRTLPMIISAMGASYTPDYGLIMLAVVIATLPTAILFFVMQKQFVQGMLGAVK